MDAIRQHYDLSARNWYAFGEDPTNYFSRRNAEIVRIVQDLGCRGAALDIGCAAGHLSQLFLKLGMQVYGVDLSEEMVLLARTRLAPFGVPPERFVACSAEALPFDGIKFDLITAVGLLPYIADYSRYVAYLRSYLKPGGMIITSCKLRLSLYTMGKACSLLARPWRWGKRTPIGLLRLLRTGIYSGGGVPWSKARQVYSARGLDRLFIKHGLQPVHGFDLFSVRGLDQAPTRRRVTTAWLARHFGWDHVGVYRSLEPNA